MTCDNCLHREMCGNYTPYDKSTCRYFKDKSRFIELPCKVGDTVWRVDDYDQQPMKYRIFRAESNMTSMRGLITSFYANNEIDGLYFEPEDIGKTVFLTREEAEKAKKAKYIF